MTSNGLKLFLGGTAVVATLYVGVNIIGYAIADHEIRSTGKPEFVRQAADNLKPLDRALFGYGIRGALLMHDIEQQKNDRTHNNQNEGRRLLYRPEF